MAWTDKDTTRGIGLEAEEEAGNWAPRGKSWFFGIGINRYLHFPNLNNAVRDVQDVLILLQREYGMESERVITLFEEEATRDNIIDKLDELTSQVAPEDKLIIYYSGHGHLNQQTNLAYWIPQDAPKDRASGYIPNSTVRDYIKSIPSLHTLLISDSCFSGTLFVRGTSRSTDAGEELEQRRSRWGIVSGRHDEEVYDGEPGTNSPFAASILKVLQRNRNDRLNVAKLADQVVEMTRANYTQLPEGNPLFGVGHDGGQYVFRLMGSEANIWERCTTENSLAAFNAYLSKFPNGPHADEALDRIKKLEEEKEWVRTGRIDRTYAYQQFLRGFPQGKYAAEARERIRQLQEGGSRESEADTWRRAKEADDEAASKAHLSAFPDGGNSSQARTRLREREERERRAPKDNPRQYVKQYWPHGLGVLLLLVLALWGISATLRGPEPEVGVITEDSTSISKPSITNPAPAETDLPDNTAVQVQREDKAWNTAQGTNTITAYNQYLGSYPNGRHATEARSKIKTLREAEAAQADDQAWQKARGQNTKAAYRQYLQQYPSGRHAAEAKEALTFPKTAPATLRGQTYNTIQFANGGLIWMAENLSYGSYTAGGGSCYDNISSNCSKYGRLYTWEVAKKACQEIGWRLPTDQEWRDLAKRFGGADDDAADGGKAAYQALIAGGKSGFSAQLGGVRYTGGSYRFLGGSGCYWSATENESELAMYYYFSRPYGKLNRSQEDKGWALSVRCVQD